MKLLVAKAFLSFPFASLFTLAKTVWQSRQIKFSFISLRQGRKENCACHFYCPILKFRPLCHAASEQRFERGARRINERAHSAGRFILAGRQKQRWKKRPSSSFGLSTNNARFSSYAHMECAAQSTFSSLAPENSRSCHVQTLTLFNLSGAWRSFVFRGCPTEDNFQCEWWSCVCVFSSARERYCWYDRAEEIRLCA